MSSRNATVIILECFALCCALFVVSTQAKYTHWIHRHHHHHHHGVQVKSPNTLDTERQDPIPLGVIAGHRLRGQQHERSHHEDNEFFDNPRTLDLMEKQNRHLQVLQSFRRPHAIKKRQDLSRDKYDMKNWHRDVKDLQNRSLCDYTVEPLIDDSINQTRVPKDLVNIRCNHVGSRCPHVDIPNADSCCTQTYRVIEVSYGEGEKPEKLTILTGCVCSVRERNGRDFNGGLEKGALY